MIRLTIQRRVFLAVFALAATLIALLLALILLPLKEDFGRYAAEMEITRVEFLIGRLQNAYRREGGWGFLRHDPAAWRRLARPEGQDRGPPPFGPPPGMGEFAEPPPPQERDPLRIHPRLALWDADNGFVAGNPAGDRPTVARPILVDGREVGRLTLLVPQTPERAEAGAFLASQSRHLAWAGAAALLLSLAAAWWLARHFLSPLRQLAEGARRLAGGEFAHRVEASRRDELGDLAADFNRMAEKLSNLEESRRQWVSDTSHELRTPIAVLKAEIEALQDGVRAADADNLGRLQQQVGRLAKLVDDLRQTLDLERDGLAMTAASIDPLAVLAEAVEDFRDRYAAAGLAMEMVDVAPGRCRLRGDADRLHQVFANLLENSLRYTAAGGSLRIAAITQPGRLLLRFDDTAPAPPPAALPRLFDRFFRAEPSRSRAHGGSGLGLAICKAIVEAHGGSVAAELSELGGLSLRLSLPLEP